MILGVTLVAAAASLALALTGGTSIALVYICFLVYGGMIFSLHPLALSHCADHAVGGDDMLSLSQGMLLANGIGLALGPLLSGLLAAIGGRESLFAFGLAVNAVAAAAIVVGMRRRAPIPAEEKSGFVPAVDSTPAQLVLDPRSGPGGEEQVASR